MHDHKVRSSSDRSPRAPGSRIQRTNPRRSRTITAPNSCWLDVGSTTVKAVVVHALQIRSSGRTTSVTKPSSQRRPWNS